MTGPRSSIFASARRAPRRRWVSVLKLALIALLVTAVVAMAVTGALWAYAVARLGGDPVASLASRSGTGASPDGATTTLVALVDQPGAPTSLESPVLLLQTGGPRDAQPVGVVLPTDLQVTAEGVGMVPLAEVVPAAGADLLVRTVSDYTGVAVDHYVLADPAVLRDLVEALGEVTDCEADVCRPVTTADVPTLDRTSDIDALLASADVVRATADRLRDPWLLARPWRAKAAVDLVADRIQTDASLRGRALYGVAEVLREPHALDLRVVPGVPDPDQGIRLALAEQAEQLFQPLRDGTPLPGGEDRTDDQEIPPSQVRILVWNGAGTAGLAAQVEARLVAEGFAVVATDNAPSFGRETTEIAYSPDARPLALLVSEHFEGAELREADRPLTVAGQPVDIRITVGLDHLDE